MSPFAGKIAEKKNFSIKELLKSAISEWPVDAIV